MSYSPALTSALKTLAADISSLKRDIQGDLCLIDLFVLYCMHLWCVLCRWSFADVVVYFVK